MCFSYYREGAHPERALRPEVGSTFFHKEATLPSGFKLVSPEDAELYYVGRFSDEVGPSPVFAWQGSELLARFSGRRLGLIFDAPAIGPVFFNVIVDGENRMLELDKEGPLNYMLDHELEEGEHELVLYKRTEAFIGAVAFLTHGKGLGQDGLRSLRPPQQPVGFLGTQARHRRAQLRTERLRLTPLARAILSRRFRATLRPVSARHTSGLSRGGDRLRDRRYGGLARVA